MTDTTLRNKARRILGLSKPSPSSFSLPLEKRRMTALEAIKEGAYRGAKTVALEWGLKDSARCEDSASYALEAVFARFLCHKVPTMGKEGKVLRFQRGENKVRILPPTPWKLYSLGSCAIRSQQWGKKARSYASKGERIKGSHGIPFKGMTALSAYGLLFLP